MKKKGKATTKPTAVAARKKKGKQDIVLWTLVAIADLIAIFILAKAIIG